MRWRLRLSEFDFEVVYKKGKLNNQADALSRLRTLGETAVDFDEDIPCFAMEESAQDLSDAALTSQDSLLVAENANSKLEVLPITTEELLRSQLADEFCASIRSRLNGGEALPFALDDCGLLHRCVEAHSQVVVPSDLRSRVLYMAHYPKLSGHPGWRKLAVLHGQT